MLTISLLVTGVTEHTGLPDSLRQVFPSARFRIGNGGRRLDGFTSHRLKPLTGPRPRAESYLDEFAARLVAETYPGRDGKPADLIVGVDDLELENMDQPELVVRLLREAVQAHVERSFQGNTRARVYERLQNHCSFHLLKPMVEAYFFGEPAALDRAGRALERTCLFGAESCDVEDFAVDDPAYMQVAEAANDKRDWRHGRQQRPRHPKKYLQFLCDPAGDGKTTYRESRGGAEALKRLAWEQVLRPGHVAYARALLADIAREVAPAPPVQAVLESTSPCATWPPPRQPLLRNL